MCYLHIFTDNKNVIIQFDEINSKIPLHRLSINAINWKNKEIYNLRIVTVNPIGKKCTPRDQVRVKGQ